MFGGGGIRTGEQRSRLMQLGPYQLIAALAGVLLLVTFFGIRQGCPRVLQQRSGKLCRPEFVRYVSSDWEAFYLQNAQALFDAGLCKSMEQNVTLIDTWLRDIARTWDEAQPISDAVLQPLRSTGVWSQMEYRDSCSGATFSQPIEPLVGLMRHPWALVKCRPEDGYSEEKMDWRHDVKFAGMDHETGEFDKEFRAAHSKPHLSFFKMIRHLETKGHQLITPLTPAQVARYYPGRKYLFDLGTGTWSSGSLPWFTKWYGHRHIEFDEIWGWEVTKVSADAYWSQWPPEQAHKMHFTNLPCDVEPDSPTNPLNIMRAIYQPGDYIAFKLDIDNPKIEHALMDQLDVELIGMISEMLFEEHYDAPEMEQFFGKDLNVSWVDAIHEFQRWRSRGLRLHYWP